MEAAPPSYEQAVRRDHWPLIAPYLRSRDICSALRVCKQWYQIFLPLLWHDPAVHFGHDTEDFYVSFIRFKRTVAQARLDVRRLTVTLRISHNRWALYDAPNADWLKVCLDGLPHLQSLSVCGLPYFDRRSLGLLQSIDHSDPARRHYELRLLDASRCANSSADALSRALLLMPRLVYLDLSWTTRLENYSLMSSLRYLRELRVLKLRGLQLQDAALDVLARAIGWRVRSLDLRNNKITDVGLQCLVDHCIREIDQGTAEDLRRSEYNRDGLPTHITADLASVYHGENFENYLQKTLNQRFINRLALDDAAEVGLTHLYICGNFITRAGAAKLLRASSLFVLDLGQVIPFTVYRPDMTPRLVLGVESLSQYLTADCARNLTYLRIHHSLVTSMRSSSVDSWEFPESGRNKPFSTSTETKVLKESEGKLLQHQDKASQARSKADFYAEDQPPAYELPIRSNPVTTDPRLRSAIEAVESTRATVNLDLSSLSNLQTLTLTDIPTHTGNQITIERLIALLRACAAHKSLSTTSSNLQAANPTANSPPQYSKFALHRILFELVRPSPSTPTSPASPSPLAHQRSFPQPLTRSFSQGNAKPEDPDAMWGIDTGNAMSFYGEDDDEISRQKEPEITTTQKPTNRAPANIDPSPGLSFSEDELSGGVQLPVAARGPHMMGLEADDDDDNNNDNADTEEIAPSSTPVPSISRVSSEVKGKARMSEEQQSAQLVDVAARLAAFRTSSRRLYTDIRNAGGDVGDVTRHWYWTGDVGIIRI